MDFFKFVLRQFCFLPFLFSAFFVSTFIQLQNKIQVLQNENTTNIKKIHRFFVLFFPRKFLFTYPLKLHIYRHRIYFIRRENGLEEWIYKRNKIEKKVYFSLTSIFFFFFHKTRQPIASKFLLDWKHFVSFTSQYMVWGG